MRRLTLPTLALLLTFALPVVAAPVTGQPAPDFTAMDTNGQAVKLSDMKGKTVVLEWTNHECPFVKKFYGVGKMQELQKEATKDGVVWVSVISSAPGKQGHVTTAEANKLTADRGASPSHVVLDMNGSIGRLYAAKTTPHMYIVDGAGILQYQGAIDSIPSTKSDDIAKANNYVTAALAAVKAGTAVAEGTTRPYGCAVKYGE